MFAYKVHLKGYKPFTMLTECMLDEIPEAIKEKFGRYPVRVVPL